MKIADMNSSISRGGIGELIVKTNATLSFLGKFI